MNIFVTGCTGFLGGELLVALSKQEKVDKIYCLIRALSDEHAILRIKHVFELHGDHFDEKRIIPIVGNLGEQGLSQMLASNKMLSDTNVIIHSGANTSFSKIYDNMVEQINIGGTEELLKWSATLAKLETFVYVGTASICGKDVKNRLIFEEESPNPKVHHVVKYTYTKMVGEMMLSQYLPKEKILVVRPSIIMGDSRDWIPRSYVILWAFATVNLLRLIPVNGNSNLDVIPVDYASDAIIALLFAKRNHSVYNISSGKESVTSPYLITKSIEQFFPGPIPFKYVEKNLMKQVKLWAKDKLPEGSELYAYPAYLEYWKKAFVDVNRMRILLAALQPYLEFAELGQIFDTSKLLADTHMGHPEPAHSYISRSAKYLKNIDVFAGAIDP
jgi:thioester reductase-like protein